MSSMFTPRRGLLVSLLVSLFACGDDEGTPERVDMDAAVSPDAAAELDTGAPLVVDASTSLPDADAVRDAAPPFVPPVVSYPLEAPAQPFLLSQVGLYSDMATKTLAPDLIAYEPRYTLWSDGADKARYLRLPPGTRIDNRDADHWSFPVGSVLFKQFAQDGKRLETRVVARTGPGDRDYFFGAFVWRDDESDAVLAWEGESNVRGGAHDVPSVKQCGTCHNGEPGRVLGFSAVQSPTAAAELFALPVQPYQVPGDAQAAEALGYLHANCAHCHNPSGSARPDTDLMLRLSLSEQTVADTRIYKSSVGVKLQSFQGSPLTLRVVAGMPEQSGLAFRMSQRGPRTQMPPIASEEVDTLGLAAVNAWITALH